MKKFLLIVLALLLIVCMASCSSKKGEKEEDTDEVAAGAKENVVKDENGTFEYDLNSEGKCEIVKYTPASVTVVDVKLPAIVDGRDIVGVADSAFKAENSIKSITVPASYTYIGDYAFYDCDALEKVTFEGANMKSIGANAFEGCAKLVSINLPASVNNVADFAFKDCIALTSVDLSGLSTLGKGAFLGCSALADVTVSDKITEISKNAFYGCTALKYTSENGALYLGNTDNKYAVLISAENLNVEECIVNASTVVIADQAFVDCDRLSSIVLGAAVTKISSSCFENCIELEFNESEEGYYLGTEENPYMVLMGLADLGKKDFTLNVNTEILCDTAFADCVVLADIHYAGTKDEWEAILKVEDWNNCRSVRIMFTDEAQEPIIYN